MSDLNIDQRLDKIENEIKALTELVAKMHVDLYMHVNNIPEPTVTDPVDYDDSLIK